MVSRYILQASHYFQSVQLVHQGRFPLKFPKNLKIFHTQKHKGKKRKEQRELVLGKTKTDIVVPVACVVPVAEGRAEGFGLEAPRTPANHPPGQN